MKDEKKAIVRELIEAYEANPTLRAKYELWLKINPGEALIHNGKVYVGWEDRTEDIVFEVLTAVTL